MNEQSIEQFSGISRMPQNSLESIWAQAHREEKKTKRELPIRPGEVQDELRKLYNEMDKKHPGAHAYTPDEDDRARAERIATLHDILEEMGEPYNESN